MFLKDTHRAVNRGGVQISGGVLDPSLHTLLSQALHPAICCLMLLSSSDWGGKIHARITAQPVSPLARSSSLLLSRGLFGLRAGGRDTKHRQPVTTGPRWAGRGRRTEGRPEVPPPHHPVSRRTSLRSSRSSGRPREHHCALGLGAVRLPLVLSPLLPLPVRRAREREGVQGAWGHAEAILARVEVCGPACELNSSRF